MKLGRIPENHSVIRHFLAHLIPSVLRRFSRSGGYRARTDRARGAPARGLREGRLELPPRDRAPTSGGRRQCARALRIAAENGPNMFSVIVLAGRHCIECIGKLS